MVEEDIASFVDKVKRYYQFSPEEIRNYFLVTFVLGFMYSFREWGIGSEVDVGKGVTNLIFITIICGIALYAHLGAQRLLSLRLGYKPEFRLWSFGIIGGVILCILSGGIVVIPWYGGSEIHMMMKHRIGHFRYGLNQVNFAMTSMMGPLANLFLAYFLKLINMGIQSPMLEIAVKINLFIAVFTILPIPPIIDGVKIFFWSRLSYAFILGSILAAAALIYFSNNFFFILFGSLFIGGVIWILYYIFYEEEAWSM